MQRCLPAGQGVAHALARRAPRVRCSAAPATLQEGIAGFYDQATPLWQDVWGEHLQCASRLLQTAFGVAHPHAAMACTPEVDMVDASLDWAGVTRVGAVLDVGCGIGGSSRHIATRFGATATGVTLSPVQVERAEALTRTAGLEQRVSFRVADALALPFSDASFDLVWSLESGEHMPDKDKFMGEMFRVLKPGGRLILVTWCCRDGVLTDKEQKLLQRICKAYFLPAWCSINRYAAIADTLGLKGVKTDDWSADVAPFWRAVIDTALTPRGIWGLLKAGLGTLNGALVMPLMQVGLRQGLIRFVLLTGTKPE